MVIIEKFLPTGSLIVYKESFDMSLYNLTLSIVPITQFQTVVSLLLKQKTRQKTLLIDRIQAGYASEWKKDLCNWIWVGGRIRGGKQDLWGCVKEVINSFRKGRIGEDPLHSITKYISRLEMQMHACSYLLSTARISQHALEGRDSPYRVVVRYRDLNYLIFIELRCISVK